MRLQLPIDFARTPHEARNSESYRFAIPALDWANLEDEGDKFQLKLLTLTAFTILLHRYTQQSEIPIAVIFSSTLFPCDAQFELCAQISGTLQLNVLIDTINTFLNQSEQIRQDRSGSVLNDCTSLPIAITFKEVSPLVDRQLGLSQDAQAVSPLYHYDLHLLLSLDPDFKDAVLIYNPNLFKVETIQQLSQHFQVLIKGLVDDTGRIVDKPIAQLPLLTSAEIRQQLVDWDSGTVLYPEIPLHQYIETHAIDQPDAIAVTFQAQSLTYRELNQRANQLARALQRQGIGRTIPVAVLLVPSLEVPVCLLAVLKAGGVYVPLDPTQPVKRLTIMLADTHPKVLLTRSDLLTCLPETSISISISILCLDRDWGRIEVLPTLNLETEISLSQTASIFYTSGTTGQPKGVMASQRNLMNYVLLARDRYGISPQDVMVAIARFTFSITMFELLLPLVAGGKLIILERAHILDFKRLVTTLKQITVLHTSPSLMRQLLGYIQSQNIDLRSLQGLRHVSVGGDLADADLLARLQTMFSTAEIFVIYGCSEISCMGCTYPVLRSAEPTKSRVGKPFKNVSVRLYDTDQNLVPIGVVGEIYLGGAGVTQGYLNRPDLTQEKFVQLDGERFYRTGDLGRFDRDGNLAILGRSDFQIKLRGIRIELEEIELALRKAPGVRDGVVVARTLGDRADDEKSLVAYVVLESPQKTTMADLRQFLQTQLPDYMVPTAFVGLEALPVNLNQKVDRTALPMPTAENLAGLQTVLPARDELEAQLIQIWENVLRIQPIGIHNNFFELGGDSLQAVKILAQIEQQLGQSLAITTLLHAPTISTLADLMRDPWLQRSEGDQEADMVLLRSGGCKPPLFCLYGVLLYRELAEHLDTDRSVYGVYLQAEIDLLKTGDIKQFTAAFSNISIIADQYLTEIRKIQPSGPYYLAGESFGGIIAYDIAQRLQAAGEVVKLVAMMDTRAPNLFSQSLLKRLKIHGQILLKQGPAYLLEKLDTLQQKVRRKVRIYLVKQKISLEKIGPQSGLSETINTTQSGLKISEASEADIREIFRKNASDDYRPLTYEGEILLFRAIDRDQFEVNDPTLGWSFWAPQLQVFEVPGEHLSILKSPNVQVMAEQMKPYLD
jgi:amino acid adenylation domain-containing protein